MIVVDFKTAASTDYPYQKWDSEGRTKLGILERMHQHKSTKLSEYHLFLMQKWLPEQRKRFEKEQRLAEKGRVAADRARAAAAKRKERRAEARAKVGMAPAMASDEVYERRGAMVDVFNLLHCFYTLSFISCNVYILALFSRSFMWLFFVA